MCDLCKLEALTKVYYNDSTQFMILECKTCHVPMAVWCEHTMKISFEEESEFALQLHKVAIEVFGKENYYIDKNQKAILDHLHWHVRKINKN